MISLLEASGIELVVLARYMRILSADFIDRWPMADHQHPPLLPAGLRRRPPYAQAHERGVKVIGATAHYATAELDAGPIIDQDVTRVSHRDDVPELTRRAGTSRWWCWRGPCEHTWNTEFWCGATGQSCSPDGGVTANAQERAQVTECP